MSKKVKIYTVPSCRNCDLSKGMFKDLDIPYEEINVRDDVDAVGKLKEMGHLSAPVIVLPSGVNWAGHNPGMITRYADTLRKG